MCWSRQAPTPPSELRYSERETSTPSGEAEGRLERKEVRRLIHEALARKLFPPQTQFPEAAHGDYLLWTLFACPVVVWVPECNNPSQSPRCTMSGYLCFPRVKEYKHRVVEDVDEVLPTLHQVSVHR